MSILDQSSLFFALLFISVLIVDVCPIALGLAFTEELLCTTDCISLRAKTLSPNLTIRRVVDDVTSDTRCEDAADEVDVSSLDELDPDHVRLHSVTSHYIDTSSHHRLASNITTKSIL